MTNKKSYPKDFKDAVVDLAHRGHSANSLARKLWTGRYYRNPLDKRS